MSTVHASTFPDSLEVGRGDAGYISVAISNTSDVIDAYEVQVFGLDPEWLDISPARLSLFPGDTENVDIRISLPEDYPSSRRTLAVNVMSQDDPGAFTLSEVELAVKPLTVTSIALDPVMVTGGRSATFGIVVSNLGNSPVDATGFAIDPEDLAEFEFDPPSVVVAPGRERVIQVTATGGRTWFGQARARTFTMGVDAERRVESIATFIQRPRISRWLISLLGLLTAAAVFAVVLSRTFDDVVDEAKTDAALIDAALDDDDEAGVFVSSDPGMINGRITSVSTGEGLSGVQAELFTEADPVNSFATGATSQDGEFSFAALSAGDYLVRLSGAGIEPLWYPAADVSADALPITVGLGEDVALDPIVVGGIPVEVSGMIEVSAAAGATGSGGGVSGAAGSGVSLTDATVTLVVTGQTDPEVAAVVASVDVAADGSFVLPDIPSPGAYQLIVEQPGAAATTRDVVLQPGEDVGDISVDVVAGNGSITGFVTGPNGPLGGATITATDGAVEIQTVTLTEGDRGSFTLRNLPTPAQYTVTIARDGLATEARTVALDETQLDGTVTASLVASVGSITGSAVVDGLVERGLEVTISGGDVNRTKPVVSQGIAAGTYQFAGLPVPATYTLTFTGPEVLAQVRVVDLDARGGVAQATGINVSLSGETTAVRGVVRGPDGVPEARATVSLTDGSTEFRFPTADEPLGEFEFGAVPPGSYTLTASRAGTEAAVIIVTISATDAPPFFDLSLGDQASFRGRIIGLDGAAITAPRTVRLFDPNRFPNGGELAVTTTDAQGNYVFEGLDAPNSFVVASYASGSAADPIDSAVVRTVPSQNVVVPDLLGEGPGS